MENEPFASKCRGITLAQFIQSLSNIVGDCFVVDHRVSTHSDTRRLQHTIVAATAVWIIIQLPVERIYPLRLPWADWSASFSDLSRHPRELPDVDTSLDRIDSTGWFVQRFLRNATDRSVERRTKIDLCSTDEVAMEIPKTNGPIEGRRDENLSWRTEREKLGWKNAPISARHLRTLINVLKSRDAVDVSTPCT